MVIYLDPMVQVPGRGRHSAGRHQVKFCKKRRIKLPILILIRDPQKWESCGTSRVAWLRGRHPELAQGTVSRTVSCHCSYSFHSLCQFNCYQDIPRTFLCLWPYLHFTDLRGGDQRGLRPRGQHQGAHLSRLPGRNILGKQTLQNLAQLIKS